MIKNQRPINTDVHLEYKCPNSNCAYSHWLSLLETQTKNFKVVCDCGTVFQPDRIKNISIKYRKLKQKIGSLSADVLKQVVSILESYGFSIEESRLRTERAYEKLKQSDVKLLVKQAILEEINNG